MALLLDVYYCMPSSKPGEDGMTSDEFKRLVTGFKAITKAENQISIIAFCSVQMVGAFMRVLEQVTNLKPEVAFWHRPNSQPNNQYQNSLVSSVEAIVLGFHDMSAEGTSKPTKAEWQQQQQEGETAQNLIQCRCLPNRAPKVRGLKNPSFHCGCNLVMTCVIISVFISPMNMHY